MAQSAILAVPPEQTPGSLLARISPDELTRYQADPLLEEKLKQADFVACRECGQKLEILNENHSKRHGMTLPAYLEKWNYPLNIAPTFREKGRRRMEELALRGGGYFGGKRHELKPGEGAAAKRDKPPTPAMRRHSRRLGATLAGKPRLDRRGKKLVGGTMVQSDPVDDSRIAELRLAGRSTKEIAAEVGLTDSGVYSRLKYLGFPSGEACRFLHGELVAKKHFADLCDDFGATMAVIARSARTNPGYEVARKSATYFAGKAHYVAGQMPRTFYFSLGNYLSRHEADDVLQLRFADLVVDLRKRWTEAYCFESEPRSRNKIRHFLLSEIGDGRSANSLSEVRKLLREPLVGLRKWLRTQNGSVQPHEILNWICEQSRHEVAHLNRDSNVERGFRTLMFLWPALEDLNKTKPGLLAGKRLIDEAIDDLLATDYGSTPWRISQAASGKLERLNPRTLGERIAEALAAQKRAGGQAGVVMKKTRPMINSAA